MGLSGYMLAAVWGGGSTNYSYPLYYDMGAAVQDHFLNWKVGPELFPSRQAASLPCTTCSSTYWHALFSL